MKISKSVINITKQFFQQFYSICLWHSLLIFVAASKNQLSWESFARVWTWSGSRAQKYIVHHSNTLVSLVRLIIWLLRTNESTIMLWCTVYFSASRFFDAATMINYGLWSNLLLCIICGAGSIEGARSDQQKGFEFSNN